MKYKINVIYLAVVLFTGLFAANANAFSVWAVNSGAPSSSNTAGTPLVVSPGVSSIDLYFDTEGDISWGWDIVLDVIGIGTISNVTGGDINGGLGTPLLGGGWQQSGGDHFADLNASSVFMFSFDFNAESGAMLGIGPGSTYSSGTTYMGEYIPGGTLVTVSAVPVPAAVWLFGSGILGLIGISRKKLPRTACQK